MNSNILQLWVGPTGLFNLGMAIGLKENSVLKSVKLRLKIDFVSHSACAKGLVYIYIYIYIYTNPFAQAE